MFSGMREGWLIIKWSHFFHSIGFTQVDPKKPMNWSEFLIQYLDKDSSVKNEEKL